jgi:hypothetical protein
LRESETQATLPSVLSDGAEKLGRR